MNRGKKKQPSKQPRQAGTTLEKNLEALEIKQPLLAGRIRDYMKTPDVVGVIEVVEQCLERLETHQHGHRLTVPGQLDRLAVDGEFVDHRSQLLTQVGYRDAARRCHSRIVRRRTNYCWASRCRRRCSRARPISAR